MISPKKKNISQFLLNVTTSKNAVYVFLFFGGGAWGAVNVHLWSHPSLVDLASSEANVWILPVSHSLSSSSSCSQYFLPPNGLWGVSLHSRVLINTCQLCTVQLLTSFIPARLFNLIKTATHTHTSAFTADLRTIRVISLLMFCVMGFLWEINLPAVT